MSKNDGFLSTANTPVAVNEFQPQAWIILTYGEDRSYGGNMGYADEPQRLYHYDSNVPNHKQMQAGDIVLILTRQNTLGLARIENITTNPGTKLLQRCPQCQTSKIKARKMKQPLYRCQQCKYEFNDPVEDQINCDLYIAYFGSSFIPSPELHRATLEPLYSNYNPQLAIQQANLSGLQKAVMRSCPAALALFETQITSPSALQPPTNPNHDPTELAAAGILLNSSRDRETATPDCDYEIISPPPEAMIESLRAIGYDLTTAVADLIDNSISAGASNIWINFEWNGKNSRFSLTDNGCGMDEATLTNAMRFGSYSPLEKRSTRDLGRFGLGLKTASLSQCERMTVASRALNDQIHVRSWDVDYVKKSRDWYLLRHGAEDAADLLRQTIGDGPGTIVLWDRMAPLVSESNAEDAAAEARFAERVNQIYEHVAMIFHRFLERPDPLHIQINNRSVKAWDPYLKREDATQRLPDENLYFHGQKIQIYPYVLPHHTKINPELHRQTSGPNGWNAQQGFYIYRNDRLLVAGDWLGLGFQKEEHYKLARIALDIPNTMDTAWELDVKKSRARPPSPLRADLRRIARLTRERASEVYRQRGQIAARKSNTDQSHFVWQKHLRGDKISYQINRQHPLIKEILSDVPDPKKLNSLLRLIEETTPVPLIIIDHAEHPEQHNEPFQAIPSTELRAVLDEVYQSLRKDGYSAQEARERLTHMEPFDRYQEIVITLPDN